jgi:hypothetical protein
VLVVAFLNLGEHDGQPGAGNGADLLELFELLDGRFQRFRDLQFHLLGVGPGIGV